MDKKSIIKNSINRQAAPAIPALTAPGQDPMEKFLPNNTPFAQLNTKNRAAKSNLFSDSDSKKSLYNTTIDTGALTDKIQNTSYDPWRGVSVAKKYNASGAAALYDPKKDKVVVVDTNGLNPKTIKHEVSHADFSRKSGEQDVINNDTSPYTGDFMQKNDFTQQLKKKVAQRKEDSFVKAFNDNWNKEESKPESSKKIYTMNKIDKLLKTSPLYKNRGAFSDATERNSFLNSGDQMEGYGIK